MAPKKKAPRKPAADKAAEQKAARESAKRLAETKKPHVYRADMGESLPGPEPTEE